MTNNYYQTTVLTELRDRHIPVTVFLSNGYQLRGNIARFDDTVIIMEIDGRSQMLYKHIISTLVPHNSLTTLSVKE